MTTTSRAVCLNRISMNPMNKFLAWLQDPQNQAAGRNYVSAILGAGAMLGALTAAQQADLIQAWGDIQGGAAMMAKGLAVVSGILGPILLGWWASHHASPASQKAAVALQPNTMVVTLPTSATPAADHAAKVVAADKIAAVTGVQTVISTPSVAAATVSAKVVDSSHDTVAG